MWNSPSFWEKFNMPIALCEHKFHPTRNWRIDYSWPEHGINLCVEIEGAVYKKGEDGKQGGRHNRPVGFIADMEKYDALTELGWHLLRYAPKKVDYDQIARCYHKFLGELCI